ncbi:MAG: helix-turn-helix domain-containing protein [Pseudonocardiaceae bacterium]
MDGEAAHTIGRRVRQIRYAREKSLRMVAGLAGLSTTKLRRIETGQRALDSRSEIVALANALQVAPSELTAMDVPAPGNGTTDLAVEAVRVSLMAVNHGYPGGEVLLVDVLRERVGAVISAGCTGDQELTGRELPALIRDLHTSIAAGRDVAELLGLGAVRAMLSTGAFGLAQAELDSVTVPTTTPETMQLDGMLALYRAEVAAADSRPGDVKPALAHADEMAERTGEGNAYWLGFGPTNTGFCRSSVALDLKDYDMAVTAAESVDPRLHSNRSRQAAYWVYYGPGVSSTARAAQRCGAGPAPS